MIDKTIIDSLRECALAIRDERRLSANTAMRVGTMFVDIIDALGIVEDGSRGLDDMFTKTPGRTHVDENGDTVVDTWLIRANYSLYSVGDVVAFGRDGGDAEPVPAGKAYFQELLDVISAGAPNSATPYWGWNGKTFGWIGGDGSGVGSVSWNDVNGKPSTLAGYGISANDTILSDIRMHADSIGMGVYDSIQQWVQSQGYLSSNGSDLVHIYGKETIGGVKTFTNDLHANDNLYVAQETILSGTLRGVNADFGEKVKSNTLDVTGLATFGSINTDGEIKSGTLYASGDVNVNAANIRGEMKVLSKAVFSSSVFAETSFSAADITVNGTSRLYGNVITYGVKPLNGNTHSIGTSSSRYQQIYVNKVKIGDAVLQWNANKGTLELKNIVSGNIAHFSASGDITALGTDPSDEGGGTGKAYFSELLDVIDAGSPNSATPYWGWNGKTFGWIGGDKVTSAAILSALGYTPYDASNPAGYITASALAGYATEGFVTSKGYATEGWVVQQGFLTAPSLNGYAKTSDLSQYMLANNVRLGIYEEGENNTILAELHVGNTSAYLLGWGYAQLLTEELESIENSIEACITKTDAASTYLGKTATAADSAKLNGKEDSAFVHIEGAEIIKGYKTFSDGIRVGDIIIRNEGDKLLLSNYATGHVAHLCASGDVVAFGVDTSEGGGGAGKAYLRELLDVDIDNPNTLDVLAYNGNVQKWENTNILPNLSARFAPMSHANNTDVHVTAAEKASWLTSSALSGYAKTSDLSQYLLKDNVGIETVDDEYGTPVFVGVTLDNKTEWMLGASVGIALQEELDAEITEFKNSVAATYLTKSDVTLSLSYDDEEETVVESATLNIGETSVSLATQDNIGYILDTIGGLSNTFTSALSAHINDDVAHVTDVDRERWDDKWDYNENTIKNVIVNKASALVATEDAKYVHKTGAETITGNKTFSGTTLFTGTTKSEQGILIGNSGAKIWFDATLGAIRTNCHIIADGDIVALGNIGGTLDNSTNITDIRLATDNGQPYLYITAHGYQYKFKPV